MSGKTAKAARRAAAAQAASGKSGRRVQAPKKDQATGEGRFRRGLWVLLAIPLIAGAGFELIRFMARHRTNPIVKVLLLPVLGTQKFTTRQPTDDMLEVAIVAFNSAREGEEDTAGAAA